jgi:hypothetical protein
MHEDTPIEDDQDPTPQEKHVDDAVAPMTVAYVPTLHNIHALSRLLPVLEEKDPAGQDTQLKIEGDDMVDDHVPLLQERHMPTLVSPVTELQVPAAQGIHVLTLEPVRDE